MSSSILLVLPFAVWGLCALHDLTSFKIPNRYVAVLLLGWPAALLLAGASQDVILGGLTFGGVTLALGFALFAAGTLGAGDAKLLAASALWIGPSAAMPFLLYTTLLGAGLGLLLLRARKMPLPMSAYRVSWLVELHERKRVMPYGVAIAGGGFLALPQSALLAG